MQAAELTLFMGKGGVGKTTVSASYAAWLAKKNPRARILLISTDPAPSLSDILETPIGPEAVRVAGTARGARRGTAGLAACEVDAEGRFREFLRQYRKPLVELLESGTFFERSEIEPLLESTIPGMAEIAGLLALDDALTSGRYDHVVADTAPFGHTLRLLEMPQAFARLLRFLEVAASRDAVLAAHFGGKLQAGGPPVLQQWRALVEQIVETLRTEARLVLVTTPEPFALNESVRVGAHMAQMELPLRFEQIVLNRVVARSGDCRRCAARAIAAREAGAFLKKNFPGVPVQRGEDPGFPIMGLEALAAFGRQIFGGGGAFPQRLEPRLDANLDGTHEGAALRRRSRKSRKAPSGAEPVLRRSAWPVVRKPLALTLGKGGVGKTTISAALAFHTREAGKKKTQTVVVCSTDPAPSLDDVFETPVGDQLRPVLGDPRLRAAEMDAAAEFESWALEMKRSIRGALSPETSGVHVDLSFERQLFEALLDIVPPGVDEIFGVLRVSDLLAGERGAIVVLDMAPTGHALELLRTPARMLLWSRLLLKTLAQHRTLRLARDLGAQIAMMASRVRQLAATLRNTRSTTVSVVALAEPLPDRQTARLLHQLRLLGLRPAGLFVNRLLFAADSEKCRWCRRKRQWQLATLGRLRRQAATVYVVRERAGGISGRAGLAAFTKELWKLE